MEDKIFEYIQSFGDDEIAAWTTNFDEWWHGWCDKLNLPYDTSFYDFTLALRDYLYPNGTHNPNRAERRKMKRKKQ